MISKTFLTFFTLEQRQFTQIAIERTYTMIHKIHWNVSYLMLRASFEREEKKHCYRNIERYIWLITVFPPFSISQGYIELLYANAVSNVN